jgi:uncharacterized protein DUF3489
VKARLSSHQTRNCTRPRSTAGGLALWNALPGVEKRRKVGDRDALIDQLWSAIEALPEPQSDAKRRSKQDAVIAMLRRPEGATVDEVASATGWQRHRHRAGQHRYLHRLQALLLGLSLRRATGCEYSM